MKKMKKISSYIKNLLMWLWQFPQNMLALCIEGILCEAAYREGIAGGNTMIYNDVLPTMSFRQLYLCEYCVHRYSC